MLQNTSPEGCAGVLSVINTYYNRDVPIGSYKGTDLSADAPYLDCELM